MDSFLMSYAPLRRPTTVLVIVASGLYVLYRWRQSRSHKSLPGPFGLPLIGHAYLTLLRNPARYIVEHWWPKYGNVIKYKPFGQETCVLMGYETIHEAFINQADLFSERPPFIFNFGAGRQAEEGLVFASNSTWKQFRTHALAVLREHGMGKNLIQDKLEEEQRHYITYLSTLNGPQDIYDVFKILKQSGANIIGQVIYGKRFDLGDNANHEILRISDFIAQHLKVNSIPLAQYFPGDPFGYWKEVENFEKMKEFFREQIREHEETLDDSNSRDYIDSFLIQQRNHPSPLWDENRLIAIMWQLFLAGSDTTSATLLWAFLMLIKHPDVQEKLYQEITAAIGTRCVRRDDRPRLPYTCATLSEIHRMASVAGNSLAHKCSRETTLDGCVIPKGMRIFANFWSVHHNPAYFPEPELFKPERYLDENGVHDKSREKYLLQFSLGRRSCLGEQLARDELLMYVASTVQHFKVTTPDPKTRDVNDRFYFVRIPDPYSIEFIPRTE